MKKIVVLLSSYNGEKYIETQLDSILKQRVNALVQIIVRDDGSSDRTRDILAHYTEKNKNITVIFGENKGYIASFFDLIKNAPEADYYALSDQDDKWLSNKLQCAMKAIEKEESRIANLPVLYGSSSFLVHDDMKIYGETQKQRRCMTIFNTMIQNIMPGHSQMFNKELLKIINDMNIECNNIYVHDSFITNIAMIRGKIVFDNRSHTLYRQGEDNSLGYGIGTINWISERIRRIKKKDSNKYALQMHYIVDLEKEYLDPIISKEMNDFFTSQNSIVSRMKYIFKTKLYRQKLTESILFRIVYLTGGYKI